MKTFEIRKPPRQTIGWQEAITEPFRLFFPAAVLAGLLAVIVWPLYFGGIFQYYPGTNHARLMAHGFFGGFIFGFLGTALPRMLGGKPLRLFEVGLLLGLYFAMLIAHFAGKTVVGDTLFLLMAGTFGTAIAGRFRTRRDIPPPGFVLVGLAFACLIVGSLISLLATRLDNAFFWISLQRLLFYQGFILLPVLGVGGFILPRFFDLPSRHRFPDSIHPPPGWTRKAVIALGVGLIIILSFVLEAAGWLLPGYLLRLGATAAYLLHEIPFYRSDLKGNTLALSLKTAFVLLLAGMLAILFFPAYRVGLLHLTLVGGLGVITLTVATRVVFGHSGNAPQLKLRNRWFIVAVVLMLLGMATRISGDFWPKILASHYNYGALCWAAGVLLWAWYVLPKVLAPDPDSD